MPSAARQKRARAPRRPAYVVVVVPPERPSPEAAAALLTWLAERGKAPAP